MLFYADATGREEPRGYRHPERPLRRRRALLPRYRVRLRLHPRLGNAGREQARRRALSGLRTKACLEDELPRLPDYSHEAARPGAGLRHRRGRPRALGRTGGRRGRHPRPRRHPRWPRRQQAARRRRAARSSRPSSMPARPSGRHGERRRDRGDEHPAGELPRHAPRRRRPAAPPGLALVDGHLPPPGLPCPCRPIIGGDGLALSIAAASIVAKVARDRMMVALAQQFPGYGWETNMGYGTGGHSGRAGAAGGEPTS